MVESSEPSEPSEPIEKGESSPWRQTLSHAHNTSCTEPLVIALAPTYSLRHARSLATIPLFAADRLAN